MKYIKIKSVSWWSAFVPLITGIFVAAEPLHGLSNIVAVIDNATGGLTAPVLINIGLAGIGLRGAIK